MKKEPIRVLQVIGKMDRAGAETLIMNIYRNIDRNKVQFDFVVHTSDEGDYDKEIEKLGGKIYHAPKYTIINRLQYQRFWNKFFKENCDYHIIHGHIRSCAPIYLKVAKKYGLYTICHSHNMKTNSIRGKLYSFLTRNIPKYSDYFFGCSTQSIIDGFGSNVYNSDDWSIIKNGIEPTKFKYNKQIAEEYRNKLKLQNKFIIGHIGRLTYQKNHKFLIDIFEQIKKEKEDSILVLVGRGELEEEIKQYAKNKGLLNDIKFLGVREDVNNLLMMFDVFVLPSHYEGLPVIGIESQATGIRCFVSDIFTDEAILSDNVYKLNLNQSAQVWANTIIKNGLNYKRKNMKPIIEKAGFDITKTAIEIEKFYLKSNKK